MSRRFAKAAAAALVCVFSLAGAESLARHGAETRVASFLASHPGLRVAAVRASPATGALVLQGITARMHGAGIAIGRLRLPLHSPADWLATAAAAEPAVPSPAPAAGTIRAENVVVTQGATTLRIKQIDIAGTTLSNADLAALLDSKTSDSLESRLRKLTATAVVIPEIEIDDSTAGSERHALLRKILLADVHAGKAAAVSAAEASLALTDGQAVVNGVSGTIEASGVDLAQVAHVVRAPRGDGSEPVRPLLAKAVINALRFTNAAQDAGLAATSVVATDVSGRPLAGALAVADAATPGMGAAALLSDIAGSFSIGTLDVDGFAAHGKATGDETRIAAAHVGLAALGDGKIGGLGLRDFNLDGAYARLAIGTADVGVLQLPAPTGESRVAARPGRLDLGQVSVEVIPRDSPDAATMRFTIDHVAAAQDGGPSTIPASGSATLSNLSFEIPRDSTLTRALYDMGYHRVTMAAGFASSYDAGTQELTVDRLSMSEPAMGSVAIALHLANVSPGLLSPDPETAQASAVAVLAKSIDLRLVNTGLFEKAIAYKARQDGVSVADERTSGVDFFANRLPQMFGDDANAKTIGGAIAKFIADPKTLHVTLSSSEGLGVGSIGMLADPGALLDSLDVHASAND